MRSGIEYGEEGGDRGALMKEMGVGVCVLNRRFFFGGVLEALMCWK